MNNSVNLFAQILLADTKPDDEIEPVVPNKPAPDQKDSADSSSSSTANKKPSAEQSDSASATNSNEPPVAPTAEAKTPQDVNRQLNDLRAQSAKAAQLRETKPSTLLDFQKENGGGRLNIYDPALRDRLEMTKLTDDQLNNPNNVFVALGDSKLAYYSKDKDTGEEHFGVVDLANYDESKGDNYGAYGWKRIKDNGFQDQLRRQHTEQQEEIAKFKGDDQFSAEEKYQFAKSTQALLADIKAVDISKLPEGDQVKLKAEIAKMETNLEKFRNGEDVNPNDLLSIELDQNSTITAGILANRLRNSAGLASKTRMKAYYGALTGNLGKFSDIEVDQFFRSHDKTIDSATIAAHALTKAEQSTFLQEDAKLDGAVQSLEARLAKVKADPKIPAKQKEEAEKQLKYLKDNLAEYRQGIKKSKQVYKGGGSHYLRGQQEQLKRRIVNISNLLQPPKPPQQQKPGQPVQPGQKPRLPGQPNPVQQPQPGQQSQKPSDAAPNPRPSDAGADPIDLNPVTETRINGDKYIEGHLGDNKEINLTMGDKGSKGVLKISNSSSKSEGIPVVRFVENTDPTIEETKADDGRKGVLIKARVLNKQGKLVEGEYDQIFVPYNNDGKIPKFIIDLKKSDNNDQNHSLTSAWVVGKMQSLKNKGPVFKLVALRNLLDTARDAK